MEFPDVSDTHEASSVNVSLWLKVLNVYQPAAARCEPIQSKHITHKHEENSAVQFYSSPLSPFSLLYEQFAE